MSALLLLAALVVAPVICGGFGEFTNGIVQVLVLAGAGLWLACGGRSRQWTRPPGAFALLALVVIAAVATLSGEAFYYGLRFDLMLVTLVGAYILSSTLSRDRRFACVAVWLLAVTALGICAYTLRNYALLTGGGALFWRAVLSSGEHHRAFGTFVNPNFFSGFIVISGLVTLGVALVVRRSAHAALAVTALAVQLVMLLLTGAKFGVVAFAGGFAVFLLLAFVSGAWRQARRSRVILLLIVTVSLAIVFSRPLTSRVVEARAGGAQVHSTLFREYTWRSTINMIRDHALLGVGPGVFEIAYTRYSVAGPTTHAHQSYLQLAAESGLPALAAFVAALAAIGWSGVRDMLFERRRSPTDSGLGNDWWDELITPDAWGLVKCSIAGALTASALRNLVDSDWYLLGISLPFWVMAGVMVGRGDAAEERSIAAWARWPAVVVCGAGGVLSALFGSADAIAYYQAPRSVVRAFELSTMLSPWNPDLRQEYGRYLSLVLDRHDSAAKHLEIAIGLAPTDAASYRLLGEINLRRNLPREAVSNLKRALDLAPNSTRAYLDLARAYNMLGDEPNVVRTYRRLLTIETSPYETVKGVPELVDISFAEAHVYLGYFAMRQKERRVAAKHFGAAVERLKRWQAGKQMLAVARISGMITPGEEQRLRFLLAEARRGLAESR